MNIKVYHLIKSLGRGGAEMLLPETLRVHDRRAFTFRYGYFLPHKGQVAEDLRGLDAPVDCFEASGNPAILLKVREVAATIREWKAGVIHCHLPIAGVVGRMVSRLTGIPVVYTEHNTQERYHFLTRRLNLFTLGWNARIIACSDDVKRSIHDFTGWPDARVLSLQNGVNTDRFSPSADGASPPPPELLPHAGRTIIGTVCVFRTQKRLHHWVELAHRLYQKHKNLHFIIVGDGPEEDALRRQIAELGMTDAFTLPGRLSEVRPWLKAMDIYLMTSAFEGLPIAMMEAMSMELPVVATSAGGIGEAVRPEKDGLLQSVDKWQKLEGDLDRLLRDADLRRNMAASARQRVIDRFSIRRMTTKLEEVYREAAAAGAATQAAKTHER